MDEKRTDLKAALRELADEGAAEAGRHAGLKRLIAYRRGTLPAAERDAVQEHLSLCARCTDLLLELRDFEAASARGGAAGPESLRQEAWDSLARRLPWKVSAVRPIAGVARRKALRRRAPRFAAGAAAALLLAVLGFSLWAAVTLQQDRQRLAGLARRLEERDAALSAVRRSLAETERQLAAARARPRPEEGRVHELEARIAELTSALKELRRTTQTTDGHDRLAAAREIDVSIAPRFALRGQAPESGVLQGGGAVNSVQIPAQAKRFTVALGLADRPVSREYRVELMDREGKVLWTGRRPGKAVLGDDGASVAIRGAGPGLYRLRIEGLEPDRTELVAEYLLDVVTANRR